MKTAILIVSEGCEGCRIAKNLLTTAVQETKDVTIDVRNITTLTKEELNEYKISDVPTTILVKDGKKQYSFVGTKPVQTIITAIDKYL